MSKIVRLSDVLRYISLCVKDCQIVRCFEMHFTLSFSSLSKIVRWRKKLISYQNLCKEIISFLENAKTLYPSKSTVYQSPNGMPRWMLYLHTDRLRDWLTWSTLFYLLLCWLILQRKKQWVTGKLLLNIIQRGSQFTVDKNNIHISIKNNVSRNI